MSAVAAERIVRMGELAVATEPGAVLSSIGLGSCIGLALVSQSRPAAGLAHVMLPDSEGREADQKYADVAVPELVQALDREGVPPRHLVAVIVGGARMFALSPGSLEIGLRNERAVRDALKPHGIPVSAAATAGTRGRTIRVNVDSGAVTCKEAGGIEHELLAGRDA